MWFDSGARLTLTAAGPWSPFIHDAMVVQVDEMGTVAAAATGAGHPGVKIARADVQFQRRHAR